MPITELTCYLGKTSELFILTTLNAHSNPLYPGTPLPSLYNIATIPALRKMPLKDSFCPPGSCALYPHHTPTLSFCPFLLYSVSFLQSLHVNSMLILPMEPQYGSPLNTEWKTEGEGVDELLRSPWRWYLGFRKSSQLAGTAAACIIGPLPDPQGLVLSNASQTL